MKTIIITIIIIIIFSTQYIQSDEINNNISDTEVSLLIDKAIEYTGFDGFVVFSILN